MMPQSSIGLEVNRSISGDRMRLEMAMPTSTAPMSAIDQPCDHIIAVVPTSTIPFAVVCPRKPGIARSKIDLRLRRLYIMRPQNATRFDFFRLVDRVNVSRG